MTCPSEGCSPGVDHVELGLDPVDLHLQHGPRPERDEDGAQQVQHGADVQGPLEGRGSPRSSRCARPTRRRRA